MTHKLKVRIATEYSNPEVDQAVKDFIDSGHILTFTTSNYDDWSAICKAFDALKEHTGCEVFVVVNNGFKGE